MTADTIIQIGSTTKQFTVEGRPTGGPLAWVEKWTFRRNDLLLTFRRSGNSGPATELPFETGGDHFILKRQ
jgi:hypothetical protein